MEEPLQRTNSEEASASAADRVRSRPDPFLVVCGCFSFITIASAAFCIAVNVLSAVRSFRNGSDIFDGIFRCYAVVIGLLVIVAETEWEFIIKFWKVLEYWAGRGMLHILYVRVPPKDILTLYPFWILCTILIFVGIFIVAVMTKAYPEDFMNKRDLILLQSIASYMLLSCGVIYFVSGLLCIGRFKRARQKKEVSRDQAVRDLQELERRREELEALLSTEERV